MSIGYILRETGELVLEAITDVREKTIYNNATLTERGLMSKEDKKKLDNIESDSALSILEIDEILNF